MNRSAAVRVCRAAILLLAIAGSIRADLAEEPSLQPSSFELLDRIRAAYESAARYEDAGTIAIDGDPHWRFSTAHDRGAGFRLGFDHPVNGGREVLFWTTEEGEYVFDANANAVEPVSSLLSEVLSRFGSGGRFGLAPAALLLQGPVGIPEPEASTVDGPLACAEGDTRLADEGDCFLLTGGTLGSSVLFELWVDADDYRVLLADVETVGGGDIGPLGAGINPRRVRVLYELSRFNGPPFELGTPTANELTTAEREEERSVDRAPTSFDDQIEVKLKSVRLRALDGTGAAIEDLEPKDLLLRVDGEEVAVEAVEWLESASPQIDLPPEVLAREGIIVAPPGKLVVFFVQADLEPSRAYGQLRMMPRVRELIDSLGRDDQMAVVSFDSHLKLRHDFSRDRDSVHAAIGRSISYSSVDRLPAGRFPSLAKHLDYDEARELARPEDALRLTAQALRNLPGEKVMVFLGFGLGTFTGGGVLLGSRYDKAIESLTLARVTVFTLDISQADAHSLEVGLKKVSAATGGAFYRTFRFPDVAIQQLARAIAGHWVIYFHEPKASKKKRDRSSKISVKLRDRKGSILLAPSG